MNFDLTDRQKEMKKALEGLLADDGAKADLADLRGQRARQALLGLAGRLAGAGYPGLGAGDPALTVAQETVASLCPSLFLGLEYSARVFGRLVEELGSAAQKQAILPALTAGRAIGALAMAEQNTSLEKNASQTTATPAAGGLLLRGRKGPTINAPLADWLAVVATGPDGPLCCLVPADAPGLNLGPRLATVGLDGLAVAELELDGCLVPGEMTIPLGAAGPATIRAFEDQVLAVAALGVAWRAYHAARLRAKEHKSGGKPIIAYQEIGFKLAEMLTYVQSSQLLAYRAAWLREAGDREAAVTALSAKVYIAESAEKVASEAMQIMGGAGFIRGNAAEESYRDAKFLGLAGTSNEIGRMKIADTLLDWY